VFPQSLLLRGMWCAQCSLGVCRGPAADRRPRTSRTGRDPAPAASKGTSGARRVRLTTPVQGWARSGPPSGWSASLSTSHTPAASLRMTPQAFILPKWFLSGKPHDVHFRSEWHDVCPIRRGDGAVTQDWGVAGRQGRHFSTAALAFRTTLMRFVFPGILCHTPLALGRPGSGRPSAMMPAPGTGTQELAETGPPRLLCPGTTGESLVLTGTRRRERQPHAVILGNEPLQSRRAILPALDSRKQLTHTAITMRHPALFLLPPLLPQFAACGVIGLGRPAGRVIMGLAPLCYISPPKGRRNMATRGSIAPILLGSLALCRIKRRHDGCPLQG
jgi:hypothetical protein